MFTGIIHHQGTIASASSAPTGLRLTLAHTLPDPIRLGDSIAVDGCCLTVAALSPNTLTFDVIPETLSKTTLGDLRPGQTVHLEQSLRFGDRVDGHLVQGHVDGVGTVRSVHTQGEWRAALEVPEHLAEYLIPKGSIAVDGVSLTLARVDRNLFDITLIPTTLDLTHLGRLAPGHRVNLECDATVKTIVATLRRIHAATVSP
jgi:riboflavin synthase alpha subunit